MRWEGSTKGTSIISISIFHINVHIVCANKLNCLLFCCCCCCFQFIFSLSVFRAQCEEWKLLMYIERYGHIMIFKSKLYLALSHWNCLCSTQRPNESCLIFNMNLKIFPMKKIHKYWLFGDMVFQRCSSLEHWGLESKTKI